MRGSRHSAAFWSQKPTWSFIQEGDLARCVVDGVEVFTARRRGDRLEWNATAAPRLSFDDVRELEGTFAVALAARGFPLITTDEAWQEQLAAGFSDAGDSVGLAFKISRWEAWARSRGWCVNAPRIPGLTYPTHEELVRAAEERHAARR